MPDIPDIPAFHNWNTNADLIVDVAKLGYIAPLCLDLSHNSGAFWTKHVPAHLVTNDLDDQWDTDYHHDATLGPRDEWRDQFGSVVWDGPYRLNGTPDQGDFDRRYGTGTKASVADRHMDLKLGVVTAIQCAEPGGFILVKCQAQVASKRLHDQPEMLKAVGELFGAPMFDRFVMTGHVRKQPDRGQEHARNNASTLLVLKKHKPRKGRKKT